MHSNRKLASKYNCLILFDLHADLSRLHRRKIPSAEKLLHTQWFTRPVQLTHGFGTAVASVACVKNNNRVPLSRCALFSLEITTQTGGVFEVSAASRIPLIP